MKQKQGFEAPVVSLRNVAFEMDVLNDEWTAYVNRRTGELITVTDEEVRAVEAGDESEDVPEWQRELLPKIRAVLESDEFLALPGSLRFTSTPSSSASAPGWRTQHCGTNFSVRSGGVAHSGASRT